MPTLAEQFPAFGLQAPRFGGGHLGGLLNYASLASGQQPGGVPALGNIPTTQQSSAPNSGIFASSAVPNDLSRAAAAITRIESGGSYTREGPITSSGDRAYGRYQVMGANVPDWTARWYGQRLSPQEFLANQAAQDAVFNGQFGLYTQRYGSPDRAAAAWFAGPGNMNNPRAADILGTTVSNYVRRFMLGY